MPPTSTVYIVQEPLKRDGATGDVVKRFDTVPLERYGELVYLTSWGELRDGFNVEHITAKLREKLADFCDRDFIVPTGNPALIALAVLIAADMNEGRVRMLDWRKNDEKYREVAIDMDWEPVPEN